MTDVRYPSTNDNIGDFVEGRVNSTNVKIPPTGASQSSPFTKMVVLDTIFDPVRDINDEKKKSFWKQIKIINADWMNILPRNTIVAKAVGEDSNPLFVFPFFPSHLALPCKPGEFVWVMFEDSNPNLETTALRAYWLCRVTEPITVDDVNHTHAPRIFETSLHPDNIKKTKGQRPFYELRNGPPLTSRDGTRVTSYEKQALPGEPEDIFERLVKDSNAAQLMAYESVPRYKKRPGDLALEGTNNTLIVLGTDRSSVAANYVDPTTTEDKIKRQKNAQYPAEDFRESAGSIDVVAGRGQISSTGISSVKTTSLIKNSAGVAFEIKKELDKSPATLANSLQEGDPDFLTDRSRILVSQRTKVDEKFRINSYNSENYFSDPALEDAENGDAAIVIKSDKIRLIARSDLQIIVTNFEDVTALDGTGAKLENSYDSGDWASITIKKTGDIIFTPSNDGFIKLGGEDADKAILCTDLPAIIQENQGMSEATFTPGIQTTGVDLVGTGDPGYGTFASKVLVR